MESFAIFAGEASTPASGTPFSPLKSVSHTDITDECLTKHVTTEARIFGVSEMQVTC